MPSNPAVPAAVEELAQRRMTARQQRDFALADQLREAIVAAGFEVADRADGYLLSPRESQGEWYPTYAAVPVAFADADACNHSLCLAFHGWPEDVQRLAAALVASAPGRRADVEIVITVVPDQPGPQLSASAPQLSRPPVLVKVAEQLGHAQALNVAARRARGRLVHFVEPSLEFGWEVLERAATALEDPAVGACGPFGLATDDWREFHPVAPGDVMALEYLLTVRRADLPAIGEMDAAFRFYRNLDLDFSRQVVAAGFRLRSFDAAVERHAHRLWEATPEDERARLSRRNFNRLLDRWVRPASPSS